MAGVRIISESTVRPTNPTESTRRIELTPWDLQLLLVDYIQKGLLFHKPITPVAAAATIIDHLKTSLSRTLDYFFPLAGRLGITEHGDGAISFFIDCNGAGAQLIHAAADEITAADILSSVYTPAVVHSFFPLNGVLNYEAVSKPLLAVQATQLADGAIFIGCSMNHSVADGTSFWNFFNSWSELARGGGGSSSVLISRPPPRLNRYFLEDSHCPIRIPNFPRVTTSGETSFARFGSPVPLLERVFNFRKESIQNLKSRANAEASTKNISSLQALLAHLWRSVIRCRNLDPEMNTSYRIMIGARPRLSPPLPEEYFGNAILSSTVTAKAGDIVKRGIGFAAAAMNKTVAAQTEEEMRKFLESFAEEPKVTDLGGMVSSALVTGSSPRFEVYGNDFGWGKPAAVWSGGANKFDGKLTVFPGAEEGSVDIEACLSPETLKAMAEDVEFMNAVTV